MIVYVESNFVLELAFRQEERESCEEILRLAEAGSIELVLPAYSVGEPYERLVRRDRQRRDTHQRLSSELRELGRTDRYTDTARSITDLTAVLVEAGEKERTELNGVLTRLVQSATLIPTDREVLAGALQAQADLGLSPQDSIVYAAVRSRVLGGGTQCFINRNSKDFLIPQIEEEFESRGCKLLGKFVDGVGYIRSNLQRLADERPS